MTLQWNRQPLVCTSNILDGLRSTVATGTIECSQQKICTFRVCTLCVESSHFVVLRGGQALYPQTLFQKKHFPRTGASQRVRCLRVEIVRARYCYHGNMQVSSQPDRVSERTQTGTRCFTFEHETYIQSKDGAQIAVYCNLYARKQACPPCNRMNQEHKAVPE